MNLRPDINLENIHELLKAESFI